MNRIFAFSVALLLIQFALFWPPRKDIFSTSAQSFCCRRYRKSANKNVVRNILKVLEFVDDHGNEVLNLGSFTLLPQHVVRLILNREELKADEFSKFQVYSLVLKLNDSNLTI